MMRIFNRLHKAIGLLEYFSSQDWQWSSDNLNMLMSHLSAEDRKVHTHTQTNKHSFRINEMQILTFREEILC